LQAMAALKDRVPKLHIYGWPTLLTPTPDD
jgi:hypothetical protein